MNASDDQKLLMRSSSCGLLPPDEPVRIVILGKSGIGKSSLAKTIFGEEVFKIGRNSNSETKICHAETRFVNGRSITLIDSPGFFDTDRSEEKLKPEIVRCITECAPGPHAFLIVLKVERFTEQEQAVINKVKEYFSEETFKYATFLFTHGDDLDEGQTINDFVSNNKLVDDLVKKCGGRCHVIDNKYWNKSSKDEYRSNQFQVEELLKSVDKMVEKNQGRCYTNERLKAVERKIQQEKERITQTSANMSEKEASKQARDNVFSNYLTSLSNITIGGLFDTMFGSSQLTAVTVGGSFFEGAIVATFAIAEGASISAAVAGGAVVGPALMGAAAVAATVSATTPKRSAESKKDK